MTHTTTRCTNSEPGTFNHECGKPATWIGVQPSGWEQHFCDGCKADGWEAKTVKIWRPLVQHEPGAEGLPQAVIPGAERAPLKETLQRRVAAPLRSQRVQHRDIGGLFDTDAQGQGDLF